MYVLLYILIELLDVFEKLIWKYFTRFEKKKFHQENTSGSFLTKVK